MMNRHMGRSTQECGSLLTLNNGISFVTLWQMNSILITKFPFCVKDLYIKHEQTQPGQFQSALTKIK